MKFDDDNWNPFRPGTRGNIVDRRWRMLHDVGVNTFRGGQSQVNEREVQAHLKYLRQQIGWQTGDPDFKVRGGLKPEQQRRFFNEAFKQSWGSFSPEQQKRLRKILNPTGSVEWQNAFDLEIEGRGVTPGLASSRMADSLESALSGRSGRPANSSNLLLRFMAAHHRAIRPLTSDYGRLSAMAASAGRELSAGEITRMTSVGDFLGNFSFFNKHVVSNRVLQARAWDPEVSKYASNELQGQFRRFQEGLNTQLKGLGDSLGFRLSRRVNQAHPDAFEWVGQFKYGGKDISFSIPGLKQHQTNIREGSGRHMKTVGYTGDALNVRRLFLPYTVVQNRGSFAQHTQMSADSFYMKTIMEEILPRLTGEAKGGLTANQAIAAFSKAKDIFNEAELPLGSSFNISPGQENFENLRSHATIVVQPSTGQMVHSSGVVPMWERLKAGHVAQFIAANAGGKRHYGADVAPGKLGQGVVSTFDTARLHSLPAELVEHNRNDQAIRRSSPATEAVFAAYADVTPQTISRDASNLKRLEEAVRFNFALATITDGEMIGTKNALKLQQVTKSGGFSLGPGLKRQSVRTQHGSYAQNLDLKDRTKSQAERLASIQGKIGATAPFKLTTGEFEELIGVATRKGIPMWEFGKMLDRSRSIDDLGGANFSRNLAREILEASHKVSPGRMRRSMLSIATQDERSIYNFGRNNLPDYIGAPSGSMENIPDSALRKRIYKAEKKLREGVHWTSLTNEMTPTDLTFVYDHMKLQGDVVGLRGFEATDKLAGFTRTALKNESGQGAIGQMMEYMTKHEGVVHAGAYYVDWEKVKNPDAVPWGSGGGLFNSSLKDMTTVRHGSTMKLSSISADVFNISDQGEVTIREDLIREHGKGKGLFVGYDHQNKPRYVSKEMLDSDSFKFMNATIIGNPDVDKRDTLQLHIDYEATQRAEEFSKLHGDFKIGAAYASTPKHYDDVVNMISSNMDNATAARTMRSQRMQNDLMLFAEAFRNGKKPQLHNRQMLTAMAQHQRLHMEAFGEEVSRLKSNTGAGGTYDKYASHLLNTGSQMDLLEDIDRFRNNIQARGNSSRLFFSDGKFSQEAEDAAKLAYVNRVGARKANWGHRKGTMRLMEQYFKSGIELEGILRSGNATGALADQSRRYLHGDFFSEIFGLAGTHFGDDEAKRMVQEVLTTKFIVPGSTALGEDPSLRSIAKQLTSWGHDPGDFLQGSVSGIAAGMGRIALGDPMSQQGAGKMSTFEPRFLDLLDSPTFGKYGEEVAHDILSRIKQHDLGPAGEGKFKVHQELEKMLRSLSGSYSPGANAEIYTPDLTTSNTGDIMREISERGQAIISGGSEKELFLQVGDEAVYIPPVDMPGMERHTEVTASRTFQTAAQIDRHIAGFVEESITAGPENARENFITNLGYDWAPEGKGMGGWLRNRIPGSGFLTAGTTPMTKTFGVESMEDLFTIKMNSKYADELKRQMEKTDMFDQSELDDMFGQLSKKNKVAGMVFRHPAIGPYSLQKVWLQLMDEDPKVKSKGAVVYVPSSKMDLHLDVFEEMGSNLNQGIRKTVNKRVRFEVGPMVGMAGDFDFDVIAAMFLNPKTSTKIGEEMKNSNYLQNMVKHQLRFQMLKETSTEMAGQDSILEVSKLLNEGDNAFVHIKQAEKLAIANENIGKISSLITQTKKAALSYLPEKDLFNVMSLLEWIEQKPIGFKHVDPKPLKEKLGNLISGLRTGDQETLGTAIKQFITADSDILNAGVAVSPENRAVIKSRFGIDIGETLEGFNLDSTVKNLSAAIKKGKDQSLALNANILRGRASAASIETAINQLVTGRMPQAMGALGSFIDNTSQVMSNIAGAMGETTITNHRGVAALAAVGGLAALGSMNSQPKEMVGPGKALNSKARLNMNSRKAHKRITPNDVRPARPPIGNPMGPNLLSQRRAMIASHPVPSDKFIVRARQNHPTDISLISQQMQQFSLSGKSVSVSNSSRSIQNPYAQMNVSY